MLRSSTLSRNSEWAGGLTIHRKSAPTYPRSKSRLNHRQCDTATNHTVFLSIIRLHRSILLSIILLLVLYSTVRFSALSFKVSRIQIRNSTKLNTEAQFMDGHTNGTSRIIGQSIRIPFLVDRSILEKLDRMQETADPDEREYFVDPNQAEAKFRWPPSVTRIPESHFTHVASLPHHKVCDTTQPNPCRFLLPLRIAEQESKARVHFLQLFQLARELDRTLVLPNVGKSRLGACFRWDFETYYDLGSLVSGLDNKSAHIAGMDAFKRWAEARPDLTTAQIVSITSKQGAHTTSYNSHSFPIADIVVKVDDYSDTQDLKLPGCFKTKFRRLNLDSFSPLFIYPTDFGQESPRNKLIGNLLVEALSRDDIRTASFRPDGIWDDFRLQEQGIGFLQPPDVLLVNWDLRHPVFPESSFSVPVSSTFNYSPDLVLMAKKLSPSHPYLVIHWRMETVSRDVLSECANSLIDTLSNLLREEALANGIQTVWLATDYPYLFTGTRLGDQREQIIRSGTFRDVGEQHVEAVKILKAAFLAGGELEEWKLTGLVETLEQARKDDVIEEELLTDSGVLGILDKITAIRAALFVSGAKGCGRASSFTKQVIEARRNSQTRNRQLGVSPRNIVDLFG